MSEAVSFGARLHERMRRHGPLCAGIDPHPSLLRDWGLDDTPEGLERFARGAVEAIAPEVAVVKPQSAFFERHGSRGVAVLERTIADARAAGTLVLLDVKRGDVGSTNQGYADAYLDPASALAADAVTVSPYLGFGSLRLLFEVARTHEAGVFVLALTSNPEGEQVQHARTEDGRTVAAAVLDGLRELNAGASPLGSFGAVVGATVGDAPARAGAELTVNGPLLAPGVGAQGGTAADVRRVFGAASAHVLPSVSRELLAQGPGLDALRSAACRLQEDFAGLAGS